MQCGVLPKIYHIFFLVREAKAVKKKRKRDGNNVEESRTKRRAEAEKAGQAVHSLSDINPIVGFYLRPTLTGHISDSSDCWRKREKRRGSTSSLHHFVLVSHYVTYI